MQFEGLSALIDDWADSVFLGDAGRKQVTVFLIICSW